MKRIKVDIQDGWLRRTGWRGRWVTFYRHLYVRHQESTERYHRHHWWRVVAIMWKGMLVEELRSLGFLQTDTWKRIVRPLSIRIYQPEVEHRIRYARRGTRTWFICFGRSQKPRDNWVKTPEGYAHYTELMPGEYGFRPDMVKEVQ